MSALVLDIETVDDPELPYVLAEHERIAAPPHHKVVAIGALLLDDDYAFKRIGLIGEGKDEPGMLADFAKYLDTSTPWMVTFNGRGFDLPVIGARCFRHGITMRHYYTGRDVRYRYTDAGHFDLMDFLSDFGAARCGKLDAFAKLCGMPGKLGITGADVGRLVAEGKLDDVQRYCLCDVGQTAGVFLRVQLLRGELKRERYVAAASLLVDAIRGDERLKALADGMNARRFLLQEADNG